MTGFLACLAILCEVWATAVVVAAAAVSAAAAHGAEQTCRPNEAAHGGGGGGGGGGGPGHQGGVPRGRSEGKEMERWEMERWGEREPALGRAMARDPADP
eukprot:CAMPEP_0113710822 /NCGR_PEP_ID=MMETSP0038_2-20120614/30387_1 /TAXON_ID=2898 /ORGANISM="Cryptomonas paramecium" /LENGTH=99 /DNA_ID=CAMNT_0000636955 /DNA_START=109 /DNA_END=404 /DNA_ORIENTATION=+ /assembly_acc=CAM_ASM_000170